MTAPTIREMDEPQLRELIAAFARTANPLAMEGASAAIDVAANELLRRDVRKALLNARR